MKSIHSARRAKLFKITEKSRKVACLETMVAEFGQIAFELDRHISTEEKRTCISDPTHIAYSTLAKAMTLRRAKLLDSAADLRAKLDIARSELGELKAKSRALECADADRQLRKIDDVVAGERPN